MQGRVQSALREKTTTTPLSRVSYLFWCSIVFQDQPCNVDPALINFIEFLWGDCILSNMAATPSHQQGVYPGSTCSWALIPHSPPLIHWLVDEYGSTLNGFLTSFFITRFSSSFAVQMSPTQEVSGMSRQTVALNR